LSIDAFMSEPRGDGLAWYPAALAYNDDALPSISTPPGVNPGWLVALSGGDEPRIRFELVVCAYIDKHRNAGKPDKTRELCDGKFGRRRHDSVHLA
jgi:hypothetical protein